MGRKSGKCMGAIMKYCKIAYYVPKFTPRIENKEIAKRPFTSCS